MFGKPGLRLDLGSGVSDGQRPEVDFTSPTGMIYGDFDPRAVDRPVAGRAVFESEDADSARFSYTPSDYPEVNWGARAANRIAAPRKAVRGPRRAIGGGFE